MTSTTTSTRIPRRWIVSASLVAALAVTGACGGGKGEQQAAARSQPAAGQTSEQPATKPASGSSKGQKLNDDLNACALLTDAEIQAAAGVAPRAPGEGDVTGVLHSCSWWIPEGQRWVQILKENQPIEGHLFAGVMIMRDEKASGIGFAEFETEYNPHHPVAGLGEKAIVYTQNAADGGAKKHEVAVLVDRSIVTLSYTQMTETAKVGQDKVVELAKKMLERIG